jgi:putative DNA primase/helicase
VYSDWWKDGAKRSRRPGVWYHGREERNGEEVRVDEWLCGPLYLEASTADCRGENFGLLLRFRDRHDRWHTWNMPMRLLRGSGEELRGELLSLGLDLEPSGMRKRLHPYLVHRVPERRVNAALQVGWHDDTFVLPDRAFGPDAADVYFQSESASTADFSSRGSLEEWRASITALAPGNLSLTLTISAAFAGPLLALAHVEHLGLHLVGESSNGKTTNLQAGASVWGPPSYVRTWRATSNGRVVPASVRGSGSSPPYDVW